MRRFILSTLLLVWLVGVAGLPTIAVRKPKMDHGERFPCESCPCGCSTAAYCWDKCCCHSDEEKLAWAERNNVTPPDFLVARVNHASKKEKLAQSKSKSSNSLTSCCSNTGCASSCCSPSNIKPSSCCLKCTPDSTAETKPQEQPDNTDRDTAKQIGWQVISLRSAAQCHGIDWVWTLFASAFHDFDEPLLTYASPMIIHRYLPIDCIGHGMAYPPEPPVPWVLGSRQA